MARYEDRFPVVEAYLREAFPGASVHRIHRVGDAYQEGIRPHDKGGEMWRAETPDRDYDFAVTDEALEDLPADTLGAFLRNSPIRRRLEECPPNRRLWLLTPAVLTDAALGESP